MVKLPICSFCAKTGVLCTNCKSKLSNHEISELDVEISKVLAKNQNLRFIQKAKFLSSLDTPKLILIIGDKNLKESIAFNKKLSEAIQELKKKPLEVVVQQGTIKETLSTLFAPVEVSSIDEIFVPDGTKEMRINLRGLESDLPIEKEELELITAKVTDSLVRLQFIQS